MRIAWMAGALVAIVVAPNLWGGGNAVRAAHQGERIPFDTSEWKTDFKKHSVPLSEIISGGPPKDGIPAIDKPRFDSVAEADKWLKAKEPVILFERGGDARAYPLQILIWHEIANDTVGGIPVSITFCPLCNTSIAFDRRLEGRVLDFGTTGQLRFSDLVMYDRQTESWWQQVTGEAIVGELTGKALKFVPSHVISWETFKATFPQGKVLSRNTGHFRSYGQNPYVGYDDVRNSPFLYLGPKDERLRPMERVVTVSIGTEDVAYPFTVLEKVPVINDTVGGKPIVIFFQKGVASALDGSSIPNSRDIGTATVFERTLDGKVLTFRRTGERFTDAQTGSTWTLLGTATEGTLKGKQLTPVVNGHHFWFSWAVFRPKTLRYYDRVGLVCPDGRSPAGYRLYSKHAAERVRFIQRAKAMSLSLPDIRLLIALKDEEVPACSYLGELLGRSLAQLDARIAQLGLIRSDLRRLKGKLRIASPTVSEHIPDECPCCVLLMPFEKKRARRGWIHH